MAADGHIRAPIPLEYISSLSSVSSCQVSASDKSYRVYSIHSPYLTSYTPRNIKIINQSAPAQPLLSIPMAPKEMIKKGRSSSRVPLSPPDSPEPPSHSFTLDDAKEFLEFLKGVAAVQNVPDGVCPRCHCSQVPLNSPALETSSSPVTWEQLKQLHIEAIQGKSNLKDSAVAIKDDKPGDIKTKKEIAQASKLEFKTVNEVYVFNTNKVTRLTVS